MSEPHRRRRHTTERAPTGRYGVGPDAPPRRAYSDRPVALRGPESLGGLLLILAGIAAGISLLLDWLDGRRRSAAGASCATASTTSATLVDSGLWQPLVVVLGGGVLFVLGAADVAAGAHAPVPRRRSALLVSLAVAAAVLVPLADATWDLGFFGPGFWCAIAVAVLGLLGSLKAVLTGPRQGLSQSATRAPCARANCTACTRSIRTPVSSNAAPVDLVHRGAAQVGAAQLGRLQPRPVEVGAGQVALAQVGVGEVGLAEPLPGQVERRTGRPRAARCSSSRCRSTSSAAASAPGNCEPVSLQPSQTTSNSFARSNRQDRNADPEVPGAAHPHAGEHALLEHAPPGDQLLQPGVVEPAAGERDARELGAPPVDAGEVLALDLGAVLGRAGRAGRPRHQWAKWRVPVR